MKKEVTIYHIAKESGVSVSTVSRVLNKNPNVSSKALERVNNVIEKYNFTPSSLARAMTSNKTGTLGVIMPDITNPYFSALFLEIQRYALEFNYSIILCNTLYGGSSHGVSSPINEMQYFNMMLDKKVDGVIITGGEVDRDTVSEEYIEALDDLNKNVPVVVIGQTIENCNCIFINRNLDGGISSLVHHLLALGRKRIGFIGGEEGIKTTTARFNAYKKTLESLMISYDPSIVALSNYYIADGYRAMVSILENDSPNPTAVVAINDMVALGSIRAINDKGLRVPEDISVVSSDQFFEGEYTVPRLTTLDQQNSHLGRFSIMTLISSINGICDPINISHDPRLIIRESCGAQLNCHFNG
jgi:Transcriptional regulators